MILIRDFESNTVTWPYLRMLSYQQLPDDPRRYNRRFYYKLIDSMRVDLTVIVTSDNNIIHMSSGDGHLSIINNHMVLNAPIRDYVVLKRAFDEIYKLIYIGGSDDNR